jgi:hypothetical protein
MPRPSGIAAVILLLSAACDPAAPGATNPKRVFDSNGGKFSVELTPSPDPIPKNLPFDVTFRVIPKAGALADAEVVVDARMPAHFHGMNRVAKVTRVKDDVWKAEGLVFHMAGHWELYIDVTRGGETERAQMDVDLK